MKGLFVMIALTFLLSLTASNVQAQAAQQPANQNELSPEAQAAYAEILQAVMTYQKSVAACMQTLSTLNGCNSGTNGIPSAIKSVGMIQSLTVKNGVIEVKPVATHGLQPKDFLEVVPTKQPSGVVTWSAVSGNPAITQMLQ